MNYKSLLIFLLCSGSLFQTSYATDVTLLGMIAEFSVTKFPALWIDLLKDDCTVNFIPTGLTVANNLSPELQRIVYSGNHQAGKVAILLDNPMYTLDIMPALQVPNDSLIKIAFPMIESSKLVPPFVKILNEKFDAVIASDECFVDVYINSGVTIPVFVLPCAISLEQHLEKPTRTAAHDPFVFSISAAFWRRKNQIKILEAFLREFGNNPQVQLKMQGRGGFLEIIYQLEEIKRIHNLDNVDIKCEELTPAKFNEFLDETDCCILPSTAECFSFLPREAMARGIPCIISNNTAHKALCSTELVRAVPTEIEVETDLYYFLKGSADLGVEYDCTVEDIQQAMHDVYYNYALWLEKAAQAREWIAKTDYKYLKSKIITLVKPKKIIFGAENKIEDEYLMTNDTKLYDKYMMLQDQFAIHN